MRFLKSLAVAAALAIAAPAAAQVIPGSYEHVLTNPLRPAEDRARDTARHAAETLEFIGLDPGGAVAEYMPGRGYFTRLLALSVTEDGRVTAYQPAEIVKLDPTYWTDIQAVAAEPGMDMVTAMTGPTSEFASDGGYDLVFTAQNYHDLHGPFAAEGTATAFNAAVMKALNPGGLYVIIDHHAVAGSGLKGAARLHRIDAEAVRAEVEAAGFVFDGQSEALANADDPRTAGVFDPSIRGRTSQFMMRFKKPG